MINPDCTPGWTHRTSETTVSAYCGCGWSQDGLASKTAAKAAQREHRFPPLCDDCGAAMPEGANSCPHGCDDGSCSCGRDDRTQDHRFEPGCDAWTDDDLEWEGDDYAPSRDVDWGPTSPDWEAVSSLAPRFSSRPVETVAVVPQYAV